MKNLQKKDYLDYLISNDDQNFNYEKNLARRLFKLKWLAISLLIIFLLLLSATVILAIVQSATKISALLIAVGIIGGLSLVFGATFLGFLVKYFNFKDRLDQKNE